MKVVALGTDRRMLTQDAPLQVAYAAHFDTYTIIVGSWAPHAHQARQIADNAWAYPMHRGNLFDGRIWGALRRADVISVQNPFEAGLFACVVAAMFRKPLHVQVHTDIYAPAFVRGRVMNRLRRIVAWVVLRRAVRVRVVSEQIKDTLLAQGIRVPISVLPIFIDRSRFTSLVRKKHPRFKVALICIGRLEAEKQFEQAIQAVALARAHNHDVGLTIVGEGSKRGYLEHLAQKASVEQYVQFAGATADIVPYLAEADALLVPSRYEGYGLVIIEALSAGVPVIAYDIGIAKESGAIIAPTNAFAETVVEWVSHGPRTSELHGYPYADQESYVDAWVKDIEAARAV